MAAPGEETEIIAPESRRPIGGDQRRFNAQRAGAAHRIEKLRALRRQLRPAAAQQHSRCDVLLERRFPGRAAVTAPVQAVTREVDGHGDVSAARMRVHPDTRALERHVRPRAGGEAQRIDNAVLELQRPEVTMSDRGVPPAEVARQRSGRPQVSGPVDAAHGRVKLIRVARLELHELEKHPVGGARPQAGSIGTLQRAGERHTGRALAQLLRATRAQFPRHEVGKAAGRAGEKLERLHTGDRLTLRTSRSTSSSAPCTSPARAATCRVRCPTA